MLWIIPALLAPALYGASNVLDGYMSNKLFRNTWTLVCFGALTNALFVPFVFLLDPPGALPLALWPFALTIGVIEVYYLYPYYRALKTDDISVVMALFTIGKIFVPLFAFFAVRETLAPQQYVGFLLIVMSATFLAVNGKRHKHVSSSFPIIVFVSLLFAVEAVMYKIIFSQVSWSTGFVWPLVIAAIGALLILVMNKDVRNESWTIMHKRHRTLGIFGLEELFYFGGSVCATYTISVAPVTVQQGFGAVQPFFVLLYGLLLDRWYPRAAHESDERAKVVKKIVLFAFIVLGVVLIGGTE